MRILAIGDYAGKLPGKFKNIVKKEKIVLVLSNGDYCPFSLRKLYFKHVYHKKNVELLDVIGKKRYKKFMLEDQRKGEEVIKKLNKFPVPVFSVLGNSDHPHDDVMDEKTKIEKWKNHLHKYIDRISQKYKNFKRIDYTYAKFSDFIFIGARGGVIPGESRVKRTKNTKKFLKNYLKNSEKRTRKGGLFLFLTMFLTTQNLIS